tara:strand:- start:381 stop:896 length:516 start_codon:yes stop_codon:yes gene_type:complete
MSFLRVALPFIGSLAAASALSGTSSTVKGPYGSSKTASKSSGFLSDTFGLDKDSRLYKGVKGIANYTKQAAMSNFQSMAESSITAQDLRRITAPKTGSAGSFNVTSADLKLPGINNSRVLGKIDSAMTSPVFQQILTASLATSPRLGKTISLDPNKAINVKSRVNPQTLKA